jgi:hypothetical protein
MKEDVADVEIDRDADKDRPQGDGESDSAAASGDVHGVKLSIVAVEVQRWGVRSIGVT